MWQETERERKIEKDIETERERKIEKYIETDRERKRLYFEHINTDESLSISIINT